MINSNDPNELFSLRGVAPNYTRAAENAKRFVYTFSFCPSEIVSNPVMWQKYGQVVLNFEIVNDPFRWDSFRISSMHYGESGLVAKYVALLDEMHSQYPPWRFEPHLESLLSFLAFHKEEAHRDEQEIRLLHVPFLFNDSDANFDFRVSESHTGLTKYRELPLYVGNDREGAVSRTQRHESKLSESKPLINVISIQFGDNQPAFDQGKLNDVRYELEDYLIAKFGYRINVEKELFETGCRTA